VDGHNRIMSTRSSRPAPVQKFKPTSGTFLALTGLVVIAAAAVAVAVSEKNLAGLRAVLVLGIVAVLVWAILLRQRATAYRDTLVLHHILSDTTLPLARIDTVVVRHTLNVFIGDARYVCAGIGRTTRQMTGGRRQGAMAVIGLRQADDHVGATQASRIGEGNAYSTFVETRIEDLARSARRDLPGEPPPVRRSLAVPEVSALAVLLVALGATFLLG
jgi:hypothetical protein